jgi:hypothetical protein
MNVYLPRWIGRNEVGEHTLWTALGAAISAVLAGITWRFHVRRLKHVDVVEEGVSKSLSVVLDTMRSEIHRLRDELHATRQELEQVRKHNDDLRRQLSDALLSQ